MSWTKLVARIKTEPSLKSRGKREEILTVELLEKSTLNFYPKNAFCAALIIKQR